MKITRHCAAIAMLAASLTAGLGTGAHAADAADNAQPGTRDRGHARANDGGDERADEHEGRARHEGRGPRGGPPDGGEGHGPGGFGPGGGGFGPGGPGGPHLRGLHLTEAQQDKLFAIHHAQAPQRREQDKAIRKAHETLRELAGADKFDDARASAASRDLGQAIAAQTLAQARLEAQVRAVLTPEQREQLRQHAHGDAARDGASPGRP